MSPSAGYARARLLLKERFGDDYRISEMWVRKVTEGPIIRHGEGRCLQELADDLRSCKETLEAISKLEEIDTCRSMVKIVERLPQSLQSRWRKLAVKTLEATGRYPSIAKLTHFVSEAALALELRKGQEGQPYATRTRLGWSLNDPLESERLTGLSTDKVGQ